ncbi:hypothetical protein QCQ60_004969 [Bacillus cereus]|nr:hypothetical protein [Bacillus cereus]
MSKYFPLDIKDFVNNRGITKLDTVTEGELSFTGFSLPYEEFDFNKKYYHRNIPFQFVYHQSGDNIELEGQTITFEPICISKIYIIGVSTNGSLSDDIFIHSDNKVPIKRKVCLSDLIENKPFFSDELAFEFKYLHSQVGINNFYQPKLWHYCIELDQPQLSNGISFEDNPSMHIFSITFELEGETSVQ